MKSSGSRSSSDIRPAATFRSAAGYWPPYARPAPKRAARSIMTIRHEPMEGSRKSLIATAVPLKPAPTIAIVRWRRFALNNAFVTATRESSPGTGNNVSRLRVAIWLHGSSLKNQKAGQAFVQRCRRRGRSSCEMLEPFEP